MTLTTLASVVAALVDDLTHVQRATRRRERIPFAIMSFILMVCVVHTKTNELPTLARASTKRFLQRNTHNQDQLAPTLVVAAFLSC